MITVDVKPDLSRFRQITWQELVDVGFTHAQANQLLEQFVILPR